MSFKTVFEAQPRQAFPVVLFIAAILTFCLIALFIFLAIKKKNKKISRVLCGVTAAILFVYSGCAGYEYLHFDRAVLKPYREGEITVVTGKIENVTSRKDNGKTVEYGFVVDSEAFCLPDTFGVGYSDLSDTALSALSAGNTVRVSFIQYGDFWKIILKLEIAGS